VAGKAVVICLLTIYAKKENFKFPLSAFKMFNQFTVFAYNYNSQMAEMGDA